MECRALATDYDGTLAEDGRVAPDVAEAICRLKQTGRKALLVTGRELDELARVFPELSIFDAVVAENGALLHLPATGEVELLAEPPPSELGRELIRRGVSPISFGRVIVATWRPHEHVVLDVIREMGLELQVIFNKAAVMVLPAGVHKASGLLAALQRFGIGSEETVGVGDAENDHSLLGACGLGVAVANAVTSLRERADLVTVGARGAGVVELVGLVTTGDIARITPRRAAP